MHEVSHCRPNLQQREPWSGIFEKTVPRMVSYGAQLTPEELPVAVEFLGTGEAIPALGCDGPVQASAIPLMAYGHPVFMLLVYFLAVWALGQGIKRARFVFLKHKVTFNYKGHIRIGIAVTVFWLVGMASGALIAHFMLGGYGITGLHRDIALMMLPLILLGEGAGLYMHLRKKPRKVLPIFHGVCNLALIILATVQIGTGILFLW